MYRYNPDSKLVISHQFSQAHVYDVRIQVIYPNIQYNRNFMPNKAWAGVRPFVVRVSTLQFLTFLPVF